MLTDEPRSVTAAVRTCRHELVAIARLVESLVRRFGKLTQRA